MAPPQANTVSQCRHVENSSHGERLEARTAGAHAAVHAQAHVQALLRRLAARRQLLPKPGRPLIRAQRRRPPPASLDDFLRCLRVSGRGRRTWQSARRQLLAFDQVAHSSVCCLSAPKPWRHCMGGECKAEAARWHLHWRANWRCKRGQAPQRDRHVLGNSCSAFGGEGLGRAEATPEVVLGEGRHVRHAAIAVDGQRHLPAARERACRHPRHLVCGRALNVPLRSMLCSSNGFNALHLI